jgi:hypothetical protein
MTARADIRRCRVCGCTDTDCRCCIQRTGRPCSWVADDLCSACRAGWNTIIRVSRSGSGSTARVKVGPRTYTASCTASHLVACERAAAKAAAAVGASAWRVPHYQVLSIKAGRAPLFLEFNTP